MREFHVTTRNQWFQRLVNLRDSRRRRHRDREFFVEGVKSINAINEGWPVVALAYPDQTPLSGWAAKQLADPAVEAHLRLSPELFAEASTKTESSSELIAIVRTPDIDQVRLAPGPDGVVLLLDRPSSHGNLGTIIRAADAFGAAGVAISGHGVDPFDPRTVRASAGSLLRVPLSRFESNEATEAWLSETKSTLIGTTARADEQLGDEILPTPLVLAFGNEKSGLSEGLKSLCDRLIGLDMAGYATSLNIANMASICLYEFRRQRRSMD